MSDFPETSLAVYRELSQTNFFDTKRGQVFRFILEKGECTISQAIQAIPSKRDSSINARFSELERMDLIEVVRYGKDPLGQFEVSFYRPTGRQPIKLKSPVPLKEQIKQRDELLNECYNALPVWDMELRQKIHNLLEGKQ